MSNLKALCLRLTWHSAILIGLLCILISACNSSEDQTPPEKQTETGSTSIQVIPVETVQPTLTPLPGQVVLVAPAGSNPEEVASLQALIGELASQEGFTFQTVEEISQVDFKQNIRIVIVAPPDPGVAALAEVNPETQFLGIGIPGLPIAGNLSVIGADGERPDMQAFTAGYLAAMITEDWRIGVISLSEDAAGQAARNGFNNGAIFYCGLCRPVYPPFVQYPLNVELKSGASEAERQQAIDTLTNNAVKTVYLDPAILNDQLMGSLAQAGLNIIGGVAPGEEISGQWVATIQPDLASAVREVWPFLVNGEGGKTLPLPYVINNRNEGLFSEGKLAQVEKLLSELFAGYIDTGVDATTGNLK